ncbi:MULTISPECIES: hypothetical protein [unclassified Streptomyces]|uniref:hypothetical protein n=1 Tax=unclassified Streptomyces TaxID=2593676 RepID=UPI002E31C0F9|nr:MULTISPECIES: hypothetical protein [unclassified Streptomyces]WUC65217.1 hypothetical protein OG861_13715 [Streptomyces sp. NBC_00539]
MTTNENTLPNNTASNTAPPNEGDIKPLDNHASGIEIKPLDNHASGGTPLPGQEDKVLDADIVTLDNHASVPRP